MPRKPNPAGQSAQALHTPVMAGPAEQQFDTSMLPQRGAVDMDRDMSVGADSLEIIEKLPTEDYAQALKFGEDILEGVIAASADRFAPKHVYCAVNGKGAEVWVQGQNRFVEMKFIPVAHVLKMKRKYWEVLARSRTETFRTTEVTATPRANQDGYMLEAETVPVAPFNIRHDPAGARGQEWFQRVIREF